MYRTYQFRIKDATTGKKLDKMAHSVNQVWNYCNEVNLMSWQKFGRPLTGFDLNKLTSGLSKVLGLHSETIQAVCEEYATRGKQNKKRKQNWRSAKRSLGWIPFKSWTKANNGVITYNKTRFKYWDTRPISGKIKSGCFSQDSRGRWYVAFIFFEEKEIIKPKNGLSVGIDLGLKTIATTSDGGKFERENQFGKYEKKISMARRARKKRLFRTLSAKVANIRKDFNHKATTALVNQYDVIIVGNVSSRKLLKTRMAKSVGDAGWYAFKSMLSYKAIALGIEYREVSEKFSTVTCSTCGERCGPRGLRALGVRTWTCSACGTSHDRDVNAAKNILRSAQGIERQLRESKS